ncbi:2942_t:CDS:2 [Diversispora eburnea]|uniref:2942_t:CDS:1 n=1 Tax=Diversispora eburnea TaxID=1213867 RepID=A0A9N8V4M3_9GLOM|nr:2942_t:CDS:2 [Diversispora eburnea]
MSSSSLKYNLINENNSTQGISIEGWKIVTKKFSILNSQEIEKVQKEILVPLPEMFFGNNSLSVSNDEYGILFEFSPIDALKLVDFTKEGGEKVKVAYSKEWTLKSSKNHEHIKDVIKPYDWTYSTLYSGTLKIASKGQKFEKTTERIDIEKLKIPEPILFYDEIMLFEDELADNGTAVLSVKVRVMESGFFILQRFFLRVDDVLFKMNETRVYHEFGTKSLLKEYSSREEHYSKIKAKIPVYKGDDISQLTNPDWVSSKLTNSEELILEKLNLLGDDYSKI